MGAVCGGGDKADDTNPSQGAPVAQKVTKPKKMVVYGDYFNSDTRTVVTLLSLGDISYELKTVDMLQGKHKELEYLNVNPVGSVPLIVDQDAKVLGNTPVLVNYLCNTKSKLRQFLPKEHGEKTHQYMTWFSVVLKPAVARLVKVMIGPKAFGLTPFSGEEIEEAKTALFQDILARVDAMLDKKAYLCTMNEPTAVDVMFYSEISTAIMLTNIKAMKKQFPNLIRWITNLNDFDQFSEMDEKLVKIIEEHELI